MEIILNNGRKIGDGHPAYIIAEVGINHNGDIGIAKSLIDKAASHKIDAIKFQKRSLDEMYVSEFLDQPYEKDGSFGRTYREHKEYLEFSDKQFLALDKYCKSRGIQLLVSGFDFTSFEFIDKVLDVPIHKIPSPYVTHYPLLERVISYNKPFILSTGMHSFDEIKESVDFIKSKNGNFILLQCTSMYPIEDSQANLRVIQSYREQFSVPVGYSSHDRGIILPVASVALGACVIEKHFTFDRAAKGPDHAASVEERGLELINKYIRVIEAGLGDGKKKFYDEEVAMRQKYGVSIVAARKILPGETITEKDIAFKVPGDGLAPKFSAQILGKKVKSTIEAESKIVPESLHH